ncbi:MAG TPA: hypothetical protein VF195_13725 [Actinomycetota bacterium]
MQTQIEPEPTVRCFEPTGGFRRMTRIANVFMRPLLRSSAGKGIHELALLCFEGRRSGKHYEVPVEFHQLDGEPIILTASAWKRNLRGGADVELIHEGRRIAMRAELIEDPDEVTRIYEALIERIGVANAKTTKIGLEVIGDRMPTHEQIRGAIAGRRTVVRLRPR